MARITDADRRATGEYSRDDYETADVRPEHLPRQDHGEYTWDEYQDAHQRTQEDRRRERWALEVQA